MADSDGYKMAKSHRDSTSVAPQDTGSRAHARIEALTAKGKAVAAYLRANPDGFQEQAALAAGINPNTYWDWMRPGGGEAEQAFQNEVLPAVLEAAKLAEEKAEQDIACVESGSGAWASWHRWKLAQKYRKVFGDLAPQTHKVELTGKDGGALEVVARPMTRAEAAAELRALAASDPELVRALLGSGADGGGDE